MRIFVADKTDNKMKQLTQEQLEQVYREHPEWRTDLEVGKWYKWVYDSSVLLCVTKLLGDRQARGYGWNYKGEWLDAEIVTWDDNNVIPATGEDVEAALIAEAKRRYRDGDKVGEVDDRSLGGRNSMVIQKVENSFMDLDGSVCVESDNGYYICLFTDGKWATVITPGNDISADIQALKDKYPNYNWTIIAEEKK